MPFIPALIALSASEPTYQVIEIDRKSVFAGKLGRRVTENVTLEQNGVRTLIHVGAYHTMAVRPSATLHVGDTVAIWAKFHEGSTLEIDRIHKR